MNWSRFFLAVVASGIVASFTDWFFMGMLFHDRYLDNPEIWRGEPGKPEGSRIMKSALLGTLASAAFLIILRHLSTPNILSPVAQVVHLAVIATLLGPVPILFQNVVWMKFHPLLGVSHTLGWLTRFIATGFIGIWLLK